MPCSWMPTKGSLGHQGESSTLNVVWYVTKNNQQVTIDSRRGKKNKKLGVVLTNVCLNSKYHIQTFMFSVSINNSIWSLVFHLKHFLSQKSCLCPTFVLLMLTHQVPYILRVIKETRHNGSKLESDSQVHFVIPFSRERNEGPMSLVCNLNGSYQNVYKSRQKFSPIQSLGGYGKYIQPFLYMYKNAFKIKLESCSLP